MALWLVHDAVDVGRSLATIRSFVVAFVVTRRFALALELLVPIVGITDSIVFGFRVGGRNRNDNVGCAKGTSGHRRAMRVPPAFARCACSACLRRCRRWEVSSFPVAEQVLNAYVIAEVESPLLVADTKDITLDCHVIACDIE
jgi:hypothetical protein